MKNKFYQNTIAETIAALAADETGGLSADEAKRRLAAQGRNELAAEKPKSLAKRFAEQLMNPMIVVLLVAAAVSLALAVIEKGGLHAYAEAGIIFAVVILNSILGVFQESKAEKAIEALQKMSAATAKVRRGHAVSLIPASELVAGDMVLIEAGDAIPADMRLSQSASLQIEEAALTGESVPAEKTTAALFADEEAGDIPLGDRKNMAYMGSTVTYGRGEGIITATGMNTEMGKIAGIIQSTSQGETPLQKRLSKLSQILSAIVLIICAVVFVLRLATVGERSPAVILESFMLAVALAVAAIPEGLAAVVTIVLSIGVTNMAKQNAIIRRLPAVETLGCAQIICSDKTGTLTQNKMTVMESYGDTERLAKAMALCCDSELSPAGEIVGDPTENALVAFALKQGWDKNALNEAYPRVAEAPFDSVRKMMSTIHQRKEKPFAQPDPLAPDQGVNRYIQYTKGALDEVLRVCAYALVDGKAVSITPDIIAGISAKNKEYADKALRVLACAYKEWERVPAECIPAKVENDLIFIGLEAMIDPIRTEAKRAIAECKNSGIKVAMITGDHKETAGAIAKELGIITDLGQAVTGRELDGISDQEFEKRIENIFVYARVQPDHKVRIVNMWKKKGYVTAMTGDGVNDAPAIKSGDIGIGMGITGTDVTKNVADMVLADDNFATIVAAVGEGRRIYDNIRKTLQFLLSTNLSEVIVILAATLMGFALFKPVHLLFINLITDSVPAIALGMEYAEDGIMKRPPRGEKEGIFADKLGLNIIYQGLVIAALTLAGYFIVDYWHTQTLLAAGYGQTMAEEIAHGFAMTAAFFTLSMCELCQAFTMRSLKGNIFKLNTHNKVLWGALIFSLLATLVIIYVPFLADIFSLEPLSFKELAVSVGLAVIVIPIIEAVKALQRGSIKE
jgi:Ca2+-transporting ATPase